MTHPEKGLTRRDEVEPLLADLRRLHIAAYAQSLNTLASARDGLSRTIPGASAEQVPKTALELLSRCRRGRVGW